MGLSSSYSCWTAYQHLILSLLLLSAGQAWTFPGFQIYEADDLRDLVTDTCATALSQTIHCSPHFMQYQSPRVGQSTGDSALTDILCDPSCGVSLQSWFDNVASNCADQFLGDADPTLLGGYVWQGYNETCLKDPSTAEYCTDVVGRLSTVDDMEQWTLAELCSWCWIHLILMRQASSYSVFNDWYQSVLTYMNLKCDLNASTTMPPSLIHSEPSLVPICLSNQNYIIQDNDTCDTIALAHNMTSASIMIGNPNVIHNCSSLIAGSEICLPLTCTPLYSLQPGDTCMSIEVAFKLSPEALRKYNPWINWSCTNLLAVTEILGSVVCLGPQGGQSMSKSSIIEPRPYSSTYNTGYCQYVSKPPANATVSNGTTPYCGVWYTATDGDTCAKICSMESIPSDLFLEVNPSLSSTDCDSTLVLNTTYCVAPFTHWNDPSWFVEEEEEEEEEEYWDDPSWLTEDEE